MLPLTWVQVFSMLTVVLAVGWAIAAWCDR